MSIKITCPHCKRGMLVPEHLAGKKGRCKACQQILTVPALASGAGSNDKAPKSAPPPPSADVDAEAAALFADEPKAVEQPVDTKTIDLTCPFCDEAIHFTADLAGKRAPCPECKNIIKVPEPVKKDPKDWRKVETRSGPSGARLPEEPVLEGAWGSTRAVGVGKQALVEAGVIPEKQLPRTTWQKIRLPLAGVGLLLVLSLGGWMGYRWWGQRAAARALDEALAYASSAEAKPLEKSALSLGASAYYRRTHNDQSTKNAGNQLGKALDTLRKAPANEDRDALLGDLALSYLELAGDKEAVDRYLPLPWDKAQQLFVAALSAIPNGEARLQALRAVTQHLLARGQSERILPVTNRVFSGNDGDKAAALGIVGFAFLKAKDQPKAEKAAADALSLYDGKPPPPLRAEVLALAGTLKIKKVPEAGEEKEDKDTAHLGKVESLARLGEWDAARKEADNKEFDDIVRFRARLALAAAAVDEQLPETEDVEAALKMAENGLAGKAELSWSLYRLTQLALRTAVPEENVQALADKIGNTALRGRAQLAVLRSRLEKAKQAVAADAADTVDAKSLSHSLAVQDLVRHNTRFGANDAAAVPGWPQPQKAFGSLGIALGLQDRENSK